MKIGFSLTMSKNRHDGITKYASEVYKELSKEIDICGFSLVSMKDSVKEVEKMYNVIYPGMKVYVKKLYLPMRIIAKLHDGYLPSLNIFKKIKKKNDFNIYFYNFIPKSLDKSNKILVIHDLTPLHNEVLSNRKKRKILKMYEYSCKSAKVIMTDSEYSKKRNLLSVKN